MQKLILFLSSVVLSSCSFFIGMDDDSTVLIDSSKSKLSLFLSHNINGETHPCGCRHFPLGGMQNVAGLMHKVSKESQTVYFDTGDTFFPSNVIPKMVEKSQKFSAKNLAKGLSDMGLAYMLPGDQDFAAGKEFLQEVVKGTNIKFLISNEKTEFLKAQKILILEKGPHKVFVVGFINPEVIQANLQKYFHGQAESIEIMKKLAKESGFDSKNEFHRLVLLSHNGIDGDEELAKNFKELDWILGSHSQSFTRKVYKEGKTKIVQVLSRNHYFGEVQIDLTKPKSQDKWVLHEVRQELYKELDPNPFVTFIDDHKSKVSKIQLEEQSQMMASSDVQTATFRTFNDCMECHQSQVDFWKTTPHSLAYLTLIKEKSQHNSQCIKCHTLGHGDPRGFIKSTDVVRFQLTHSHGGKEHSHENVDSSDEKHSAQLEDIKKNYWKDVFKVTPVNSSIRSLSGKRIGRAKTKWSQVDEKYNVTHNFSGVQCLNCHDKHEDHPFNTSEPVDSASRKNYIKNKCLECHDRDQSPHWYQLDSSGIARDLDEGKFDENYKNKSCPPLDQGQ